MTILTKSGRVVIAESIADRPIHLAWGTGDGAWSTPPAENSNATALQNELGRRAASEVAFVVPDAAGDIELPTGKFRRSLTPTNNLYISTQFDFSDAPSDVIREISVFVGTQLNPSVPPGQTYFQPSDIASPGRMLHLENLVPIYRSPAVRERFNVVITF